MTNIGTVEEFSKSRRIDSHGHHSHCIEQFRQRWIEIVNIGIVKILRKSGNVFRRKHYIFFYLVFIMIISLEIRKSTKNNGSLFEKIIAHIL